LIPRARLVETETGLVPEGEGWYVVNTRETQWEHTDRNGSWCTFEGDVRFDQLGINVTVLHPGQPGGLYHAEDTQEDFLVLAGEALFIIEGEEHRVRAWDLVHCPPNTAHIMVGAGEAPSVIVAVGARRPGRPIVYPVDEAAARYGASVTEETTSPQEAYAGHEQPRPGPAPELPEW
jgi:uncharacterized cupin superfamily protein